MIRRLRQRFILSAGVALVIVLSVVVGVINGAMRGILDWQLDRVLNQLVVWDGAVSESEVSALRPALGTMLGNHFFRVLVGEDGSILALDLTSSVGLTEADVREITTAALESGKSANRFLMDDTLYAYQTSGTHEDGSVSIVFLDCTPAVNMVRQLLNVSLIISAIALIGFIIIFSLLSKQAIQPVVSNMEGQKRFITNASHELKTPLAIISANTELLEAMNGENEWTKNIESQVRRMTGLVNELVLLSRVSEQERPELRPVDFSRIVSEATDAISPVASQQGKTLERAIDADVAAEADERLTQMLVNVLLDNAVKYCDDGGTIRVALETKNGKRAVLSVSNDYAAGRDVDCSRFFERFYQEDASHNSGKPGFGIGLSTAQEIVELMNGDLRASWRDGRITFRATLNYRGARRN